MGIGTRFTPGYPVVLRGLGYQKIWYAIPCVVVQDPPDRVALFWRAGTSCKFRMRRSFEKVNPGEVITGELQIIDRTWDQTDVLMLNIPGEAHALYVMWEAGQNLLRCWYVNLQDPLTRTPIGFDTRDHWLDIVVEPDLSRWRWKDEDQLGEVLRRGLMTEEEARAIRAEGDRVVQQIRARQSPFCDGWEAWRPPIGWPIPPLPVGWDSIQD